MFLFVVISKLCKDLFKEVGKETAKVADLCCGVGFSTRALREAFPKASSIVGVDTSMEMVAMAEFLTDHTEHLKVDLPKMFNIDFVKLSTFVTLLKEQKNWMKFGSKRAIKYITRNAENTLLPSSSFDLVTIMYAFHEGKRRISIR
jgi:ubiquinone/menaquinone biosynthesis C-methylase UbiE